MRPRVLNLGSPALPRVVAEVLEKGGVLVFPTETVFGIGGDPWDERALHRVREMKGRGAEQPFTLHLASVDAAEPFARLDERTRRVLGRFLPGPYTFLLPASAEAPAAAVKEGKVGLRVPDHPFFTSVMRDLGRPLFGTSVNRTGEPSLSSIEEVLAAFPEVDLVVSGPVGSGVSSAIIDLTVTPPRALRGELPKGLA